jgi:hypothetical protein
MSKTATEEKKTSSQGVGKKSSASQVVEEEKKPLYWDVSIKFEWKGKTLQGEYRIPDIVRRYDAIDTALVKFIKEHNLRDEGGVPIRPYQIRDKGRRVSEFKTKCSEDRRRKYDYES